MTVTEVVVLEDVPGGVAYVPASTPLRRLNYYDGKFLRADDLNLEQRAQRAYVEHSNRAGGPGLVHGFDVSIPSGGVLRISDGLAIDPRGRLLLLPNDISAPISDLLDAARKPATFQTAAAKGGFDFEPCEIAAVTPTVPAVAANDLHLICIAHAEALCGHEEVFGRMCDEACVTATDRPYRHEGIVVLLLPLSLPLVKSSSVVLTDIHLRSRVASAYFAREWQAGGSLLSAAGLKSNVWCFGAPPLADDCVPLGVIGWKGSAVSFLDEWTARRERMEAPARRYWQGRMEMRPWPVFLAQVLQFQCQLRDVLINPPPDGSPAVDPCATERELLDESTALIEKLQEQLTKLQPVDEADGNVMKPLFDAKVIDAWKTKVLSSVLGKPFSFESPRILLDLGVIETSAAGYLPVDPKAKDSLQTQVQALLGPGVDLRFCAVRRDQIAHELERAQHMDRISLLRGIDDPNDREQVDVLVPDGQVTTRPVEQELSFAVELAFGAAPQDAEGVDAPIGMAEGLAPLGAFHGVTTHDPKQLPAHGVARLESPDSGGITGRMAILAGAGESGPAALRTLAGAPNLDLSAITNRMSRMRFGTDELPWEVIDGAAEEVGNRALAMRRRRGARREVVSLDDGETGGLLTMWVTTSVAADPFSLPVGGSTAFSLTIDAFLPTARSALVELRCDGRLEVTLNRTSPKRGQSVKATATGFTSVRVMNLSNAPAVNRPFTVPLKLTRASVAGKERLSIGWASESVSIALRGAWSGSPTQFVGSLASMDSGLDRTAPAPAGIEGAETDTRVGSPERTAPEEIPTELELESGSTPSVLTAKAYQDPTLTLEGNRYRKDAINALKILQGAKVDDATFFEVAMSQLFPAAKTSMIEIQPTTDWVLFRRRRREDCGDVVEQPKALRDVVVWASTTDDRGRAEERQEILRAGSGEKVDWARVGVAQFDEDSASMRSSEAALRQAYSEIAGGDQIVFAGYAEAVSTAPVGVLRAQAVVDALEPAAALVDDGAVDLVQKPPSSKMEAGTDGSVFLVTFREPEPEPEPEPVEKSCVDVFFVDATDIDEGEEKRLREAMFGVDQPTLDDVAGAVGDIHLDVENGTLDANQLSELTDKFDALRNDLRIEVFTVVGWMPMEWDLEASVAGEARVEAIIDAIDNGRGDTTGQAQSSTFDRGEGCEMRVYVLGSQRGG